jgi:hypothetical protein
VQQALSGSRLRARRVGDVSTQPCIPRAALWAAPGADKATHEGGADQRDFRSDEATDREAKQVDLGEVERGEEGNHQTGRVGECGPNAPLEQLTPG